MVCIRNDLKIHTQELKLGSNYKFKKPVNLQIGHNNPISRSRIKTVKEQTAVEDGEFAITLRKEELVNRDNCTWLSINGASSPSSCYKDNGLFGYNMDLKIDAWLISLLSTQAAPRFDALLDTEITFFDGSRVNPIEEASLVLDQRRKLDENMVFQENLEEEEVVLWLKNESFGSESQSQTLEKRSKSKSAYLTDSSDMVFQENLEEEEVVLWLKNELSGSKSQSQTLEKKSNSKSKSAYLTDSSDMVFQENLEEEEVVLWLKNESSGSESESQTLKKKSNSKSKSTSAYLTDSSDEQSLISSFSSSDYSSEVMDLEEVNTNKPLFWPLNSAFGWDIDAKWDIITISPRKDVCYKFGKSPKTCLDSYGNMDCEKGCNRMLEFSVDSKSSSSIERAEVDRLTKQPARKHKIVLEDLLLVEKLNAEGVIEQVLGLGEFDGHEGVESEFNKDEFTLWF